MELEADVNFRVGAGRLTLVALGVSMTLVALRAQENEGTTIKSVHLFDLPSGISKGEIQEALAGLNLAIRSTGQGEAGYVLWEVNQDSVPGYPSIGYDFVMEGVWPSQPVYDEIHDTPAFRNAVEEHIHILQAISDASAYSRYQEVRLGDQGG